MAIFLSLENSGRSSVLPGGRETKDRKNDTGQLLPDS